VIVPLGTNGDITVYASTETSILVDVSGWFSASGGSGASFTAEGGPLRVCDTRAGNPSDLSGTAAQCNGSGNKGSPVLAGHPLTITLAGVGGVPLGATAVVLNLTAVDPSAGTFLTVYPGGSEPGVSDANPSAGSTVANLVVATLSASGTISIANASGRVGLVVDVAGFCS
jgi:hypothetical protein